MPLQQNGPYNQGALTLNLLAPNNDGVCSSLSIHWLANGCQDNQLPNNNQQMQNTYNNPNNPMNIIQAAANQLPANPNNFPAFLNIIQQQYPVIQNVNPNHIPAAAPINQPNLQNSMTQHQNHNNHIVWLMEAAQGRGHVVAYNTNINKGRFFDANHGFYTANPANTFLNDVAVFITANYTHIPQFIGFTHFSW